MFRFTIREMLCVTAMVAVGVAWFVEHRAAAENRLALADTEEKVEFLIKVLRQDGYDVEAPQGSKGPISVPSHNQVMAERAEGHIRGPVIVEE